MSDPKKSTAEMQLGKVLLQAAAISASASIIYGAMTEVVGPRFQLRDFERWREKHQEEQADMVKRITLLENEQAAIKSSLDAILRSLQRIEARVDAIK